MDLDLPRAKWEAWYYYGISLLVLLTLWITINRPQQQERKKWYEESQMDSYTAVHPSTALKP